MNNKECHDGCAQQAFHDCLLMGSVIRTRRNNEIHVTDTILTKDVHDKWHYSKANFKQLTSESILNVIPALIEEKGNVKVIRCSWILL